MGWERRAVCKGRYYTRSRKVAGRVIREYIGRAADPIVQVIAKGDELARAERTASVARVRSEQAEFRQLEPVLQALAKLAQKPEEIDLVPQHDQKVRKELNGMRKNRTYSRTSQTANGKRPTREQFEHLVQQANRGDREATAQLRQVLKEHPDISCKLGDLTQHAEHSLIGLIAGNDFALTESIKLRVEELRSSLLADATGDMLERMLIDHVLVCWLELSYARMAANQPQKNKGDARFWGQRHERANARYLAAVKELAAIRERLGLETAVIPMPGLATEREHSDSGRQEVGAN